MPVFMTERIARSLYKRPQEQEDKDNPRPPLTYEPEFWKGHDGVFHKRAALLAGQGISPGDSVLVVGCGYGILVKLLLDQGFDAWGIDPSPWCWKNMPQFQPDRRVTRRIVNDWVGSGTAMNALAMAGAFVPFDWVVDEDAAPAHGDEELPDFVRSLDEIKAGRNQIVHFVSPLHISSGPGDSSQNWKTLRDWQSVAPHHIWLE